MSKYIEIVFIRAFEKRAYGRYSFIYQLQICSFCRSALAS